MMRFVGPADQEKIRSRFEKDLAGQVKLVLFVQPPTGLYVPGREESQTGKQAQALMQELTELSDKIQLEVHNPRAEPELAQAYGIERHPALIIEGPGGRQVPTTGTATPTGRMGLVRFYGLPSGYEFSTLLEDIVDVSRGTTRLSEAAKQAAAALPGPLHLQVFVTPT